MKTLRLPIAGTAAVVLGALALAGCSATPPTRYQTLDELKTAFVDAGGTCDGWEPGDTTGPWSQYGNCGSFGESNEVVLSIYASADDLKTSIDGTKERSRTASALLSGENWLVKASREQIDAVRGRLGGTVTTLAEEH